METELNIKNRTLWNRIWFPNEEDYIALKVFQMISIPLTMILIVVVSIFLRSSTLIYILYSWFIIAFALGLIVTLRHKKIIPKKDKKGS